MSVSKLCSTVTGLYSGEMGVEDEKYTYKYLQDTLTALDEAVGYTKRGGRRENFFPSGSEERLKNYREIGEIRKNPGYKVPTGTVSVTVMSPDGEPMVAELRILPADKESRLGVSLGYTNSREIKPITDIAAEIYGAPYEINQDSDYVWYDFFRRVTDENGLFTGELPCGKYEFYCDKGSEYEIVHGTLTVPGETTVTLRRIVDLTAEHWYAGDLHHHSVYSSPAYPPQGTDYVYDSAKTVRDSMRAKGLTFGGLSDHHNVLNHREWESLKTSDFLPIISKEISTSNGHVLQLNTDPDVIYNIPEEKDRSPEIMRAEWHRVTDEIKSYGGHPQINHPRDMQKAISFPPEFTDILDIFYTIEVWNGSHPLAAGCTNGKAYDLYLSQLEAGKFIAATTGSDTHEVTCEFWQDSLNYFFGIYQAVQAAVKNTCGPRNEKGVVLSEDMLKTATEYYLPLMDKYLPLIKKWGFKNISSGCVRTYVHVEDEKKPENVLAALRRGDSFLSNGPIIIPSFGNDEEPEISLKIFSNQKLRKLEVRMDSGFLENFDLAEPVEINGGYDYSCNVELELKGHKWVIFKVYDDITTQAVTNPMRF